MDDGKIERVLGRASRFKGSRSNFSVPMRWFDQAELQERCEDDPLCWSQLRLGDLDHRRVTIAQLENPTPCAGRRVIDTLSQFDDVAESSVCSRHGPPRLGRQSRKPEKRNASP